MSQGFLVLICKNLWHMIPFIWGKVKGSARWSWWQMQFIRVIIRLDRKKITVQYLLELSKTLKDWRHWTILIFISQIIKSHVPGVSWNYFGFWLSNNGQTRQHNRNIYAQSRMSASTPHTQIYWSLIFEWTWVYTHWVCDWFLFWWLCAHTSLLHALLAW